MKKLLSALLTSLTLCFSSISTAQDPVVPEVVRQRCYAEAVIVYQQMEYWRQMNSTKDEVRKALAEELKTDKKFAAAVEKDPKILERILEAVRIGFDPKNKDLDSEKKTDKYFEYCKQQLLKEYIKNHSV